MNAPWYPGDVKPVRVGLYERNYRMRPILLWHWNGHEWRYLENGRARAHFQEMPWRGLTEKQQ